MLDDGFVTCHFYRFCGSKPIAEQACLRQDITDAADGEDVLVVAHWDAVSGSIARLRPWAIADHVIHTGFTVSWRERKEGEPLEISSCTWLQHTAICFSHM